MLITGASGFPGVRGEECGAETPVGERFLISYAYTVYPRRPQHNGIACSNAEGGLLAGVDRATGDASAGEYESELWIVDAGQVAQGPVCRVQIPLKQKGQIHGWWVPTAELEKSRRRA